MAKKKEPWGWWALLILAVIVILLFSSGYCNVYQKLEKYKTDYDYRTVKASYDPIPHTSQTQTTIKLENMETIPGVFIVETELRTKKGEILTRTAQLSLLKGQPKTFFEKFAVTPKDIAELSYTVTPPKKVLLRPSYKFFKCGQ